MNKRHLRKCLHCKQMFTPDPRTRDRQRSCGEAACRKASKAASQKCWADKPENRDYHRGPQAVERVRRWRAAHPGYWRKKPPTAEEALQDDLDPQPAADQQVNCHTVFSALQDDSNAQVSLLLGVISIITGDALQEDIVKNIRRMQDRGQSLMGMVPAGQPLENSS
ncbi:MAG: hypothetical protein P5672_23340 [Limnospira sp. PMC 1234.20]|nr:hypothetical protein [Limnospira sp. PMC 1234.20]